MTNHELDSLDSIDRRTRRALVEPLTVLDHDATPVESRETTVVTVTSASGSTYDVDVVSGACSCPDARHREPEGGCKHVRRARVSLGCEPVDARTIRALGDDVDPQLGAFAPGPRVATSDGGIVDAGDDAEIVDESDDTDADDGGRPNECECGGFHYDAELPCWPCYRDGFETVADIDG